MMSMKLHRMFLDLPLCIYTENVVDGQIARQMRPSFAIYTHGSSILFLDPLPCCTSVNKVSVGSLSQSDCCRVFKTGFLENVSWYSIGYIRKIVILSIVLWKCIMLSLYHCLLLLSMVNDVLYVVWIKQVVLISSVNRPHKFIIIIHIKELNYL